METEGVRETEGERRTGRKGGREEGREREYLICILDCQATSCIHRWGSRSHQRGLALETSRLLNALHPVCAVSEPSALSQRHTHTHTHTHSNEEGDTLHLLASYLKPTLNPKPAIPYTCLHHTRNHQDALPLTSQHTAYLQFKATFPFYLPRSPSTSHASSPTRSFG
jgi:hypothetical protein